MEHALDLDTGRVLRPADVPAYLAHPSNAGRVVRVMGVAPFSPPTHRTVGHGEPAGVDVTPLTSPGGSPRNNGGWN